MKRCCGDYTAMNFFLKVTVPILLFFTTVVAALGGEANVIEARAVQNSMGTWTIFATVKHADEGWDHYADKWEVLGPDGEIIATRTLLHPHVGEQPFTRSLGGILLPESITQIRIRAHDLVHGYGGAEFEIILGNGQ